MPKNVMGLPLLCLMMLLSSCADNPQIVETQTVKIGIPAELLTCSQWPEVEPVTLQSQFSAMTINGWLAWDDCAGKLAAIKEKVLQQGE